MFCGQGWGRDVGDVWARARGSRGTCTCHPTQQPRPTPQSKQQGNPEGQAALAELTGKVEGSKAWLVADAGYDDMAIDAFWEVGFVRFFFFF